MRLRSVALTGALVAGLLGAVPAAAQAASPYHISCQNNKLHRTAVDLYLSNDEQHLSSAHWNTDAAFHPDRITFSAFESNKNTWFLAAAAGGSSSTPDDVQPNDYVPHPPAVVQQPTGLVTQWRMTVFDSAMGDCQAYLPV